MSTISGTNSGERMLVGKPIKEQLRFRIHSDELSSISFQFCISDTVTCAPPLQTMFCRTEGEMGWTGMLLLKEQSTSAKLPPDAERPPTDEFANLRANSDAECEAR
jgi:hypothetical protein